MNTPIPVCDVISDGSSFEGTLKDRKISGSGKFHSNDSGDGGTIEGTVHEGPTEVFDRRVRIIFRDSTGTLTVLP